MFTIKSPVKGYKGDGYGLSFNDGEATTENKHIAERLKSMGYTVVSTDETPDGNKRTNKK